MGVKEVYSNRESRMLCHPEAISPVSYPLPLYAHYSLALRNKVLHRGVKGKHGYHEEVADQQEECTRERMATQKGYTGRREADRVLRE